MRKNIADSDSEDDWETDDKEDKDSKKPSELSQVHKVEKHEFLSLQKEFRKLAPIKSSEKTTNSKENLSTAPKTSQDSQQKTPPKNFPSLNSSDAPKLKISSNPQFQEARNKFKQLFTPQIVKPNPMDQKPQPSLKSCLKNSHSGQKIDKI